MPYDIIPLRPSWVEVNLSAIENNARQLVQILGTETDLLAMVKANGYGHGAIETSRAALRGGAKWLGVYALGEALELRDAAIDSKILVVGPTPPRWVGAGVARNISLTIFSLETARAASDAALQSKKIARLHVKVDTGMTRLGVQPGNAVDLMRTISALPQVQVEGIFTHFARSDESNEEGVEFTNEQLARFLTVCDTLARERILIPYRHAANSPASLNLPDARLNLARAGILIYGLDPSNEIRAPRQFLPALTWKTEIAQIQEVPTNTPVSYGGQFRTERRSRIGVLMVGYGDGFRRTPRAKADVLVGGKRTPIVGRVCMDQAMIDVTDSQAQVGDEVVLIGKQGAEEISAEEVGEKLGTNNYEIVTTINPRVPRIYKG